MALSSRWQRSRVVRKDSPKELPQQTPLKLLFFSNEFEAIFNTDYVTWSIVKSKQFNSELFSSNGLKIHALFRKQCIVKFSSIKENVYPWLVRLFYANLHHPFDNNGVELDLLLSWMDILLASPKRIWLVYLVFRPIMWWTFRPILESCLVLNVLRL